MENYNTVTEAIAALRLQGYQEDFNLKQNCLECRGGAFKIFHNEFHIDKHFRFEDNTSPDDQAVVYAISSDKHHLKGVLVNAYGIYSEPIADEMLAKLKF